MCCLYFTPVNHESKSYAAVTLIRDDQLSYCRGEDAAKALTASQGKRFFGTLIEVQQHEGIGRYHEVIRVLNSLAFCLT